ncbi:MAG: hypothetical protein JWM46_155 [Candidatus Kaiserbacteria bacterium]|nr:hypothetical protein [Candidatus Kaiserbacteria bacterium]
MRRAKANRPVLRIARRAALLGALVRVARVAVLRDRVPAIPTTPKAHAVLSVNARAVADHFMIVRLDRHEVVPR